MPLDHYPNYTRSLVFDKSERALGVDVPCPAMRRRHSILAMKATEVAMQTQTTTAMVDAYE